VSPVKNNLMNKFLNFVGVEEVDDYEDEAPEPEWEPDVPKRKRVGLVSLPGAQRGAGRDVRVVVSHPRSLEDGQMIADQIKDRRPVIVNLDLADERSGQRLLNFLSGVVYALDGSLRKVGDGIYLATPSNIEVASEDRDEDSWVTNFTK
jgi:cell division inhibitor SepF